MNRTTAALIMVLVSLVAIPSDAQTPDPAQVLAEARQAIGGQTALEAVRSFSVAGSWIRNFGTRSTESQIELDCELPDKFVRTIVMDSGPFRVTQRRGFNGDNLIEETTPERPMPPEMKAQNDRIAREVPVAVRVIPFKLEFSRLFAALFAAAPDALSMEFSYFGQEPLEGRIATIIEARYQDDQRIKIYFDARTHLPVLLTWTAPPVVTFSTSKVVAVNRRTGESRDAQLPAGVAIAPPPPDVPPGTVAVQSIPKGDPTVGLPPVEHRLVISDYKVSKGLNWPHRFTEYVDGQLASDERVGGYSINPKIDPRRFQLPR